MGECLVKAGSNNLVAMDLSKVMLEEAKGKHLYNEFQQMALGRTLSESIARGAYLADRRCYRFCIAGGASCSEG